MSASIESRALEACRKYVSAGDEIKRLTRAIGDALDGCPGTGESPSDESYRPTHLADWYKHGDIAQEWAFMGYSGPDYEALFLACPHCVKADALIQQRKAARQTLGAAKRFITTIGRTK